MPRNGSGVYSKPAGTTAVTNTTIESAKYNQLLDDIAADLNTARPIVAGGTGATSASVARTNLGFSADAANVGVKGADIASAATTDLSAATGDYVVVTGTTAITALGTSPAGTRRVVRFSGILTLTHNATSLILPDATSIVTAAGDVAIFVSEGSGNWRCINYQRASSALSFGPPGYIFGLTPSINSGTPSTNIDVAVGAVASSSSPYYMLQLASSITKNTNSAWAVGTGNGSLDTGAIANSTYYGYVIQRSDTGVTDVLTSLSSSAPTMPTNYDRRSPVLFTFTRAAGVNGRISFVSNGYAEYTTYGTTLTQIPLDDTIPQFSEGGPVCSLIIVPSSSTARYRIRASVFASTSVSSAIVAAVFSDLSTNALVSGYTITDAANFVRQVSLDYEWTPGSTSPRTVSLNAGPGTGSTMYLNGNSSGRVLGGSMRSFLSVQEVKP